MVDGRGLLGQHGVVLSLATIVVATDFGETADAAVAYARAIALETGAEVHLAHVFDPEPLGAVLGATAALWTGQDFVGRMRTRAAELLGELRDAQLEGVAKVEIHALEDGSPVTAIGALAEEVDADLLVTGTHGRRGADRVLLGSVAERLVRHAPCSVLAVRSGRPEGPPTHALVCTDLSPEGERALDAAEALAEWFPLRVSLCHVYDVEPTPLASDLGHPRLVDSVELVGHLRGALEKRCDERFGGRADAVLLESAHPAQAIVAHAAERSVDLVVVATHGRTGLRRMLIGSVAERVTRTAPCAVWVHRAPKA